MKSRNVKTQTIPRAKGGDKNAPNLKSRERIGKETFEEMWGFVGLDNGGCGTRRIYRINGETVTHFLFNVRRSAARTAGQAPVGVGFHVPAYQASDALRVLPLARDARDNLVVDACTRIRHAWLTGRMVLRGDLVLLTTFAAGLDDL